MAICLENYQLFNLSEEIVVLKHKEDQSIIQLPNDPAVLELIQANCVVAHEDAEVEDEQSDIETGTGGKVKWTADASRCLIAQYAKHEKDFLSTTKRNDQVWQDISTQMKLEGHQFSSKQVEFKWKHLRRLYLKKKRKHGTKSTGTKPVIFKLFDEMDAIYSKKYAINPVAIASSSKGSQLNPDVVNGSFDAVIESTSQQKRRNDSPSTSSFDNEKQKTINEIIGWLDASNKRKEEIQQQRHNELLEVQKEAVNAFTNVMTKLIEKM